MPLGSATQFILLNSSAICFSVWLIYFLKERGKLSVVGIIVLIFHALGVFSLINYFVTANTDVIYNDEYALFAFDHTYLIALSNFIPAISIFLVSTFMPCTRHRSNGVLDRNKIPGDSFNWFILFVSLNTIAYGLVLGLGSFGPVGYLVSVTHATFTLYMFFVGYWNIKLKWFPIAFFALFAEVVTSILAGGRFPVFLQTGLFFVGYLISRSLPQRKVLIVAAFILLPFVYSLIGIMGIVRDEIGRTREAFRTTDRVSIYLSTFSKIWNGGSDLSEDEISNLGKGRNINWPSLAVIALSPEVIPYAGFENLDTELEAVVNVVGISAGTDLEEILESREAQIEKSLGTGMANRYGYMVTRDNSVEWGLLSDSWSKGGPIVFLIFYTILFAIFVFIENKIARMNDFYFLIYFSVLINIVWLTANSLPFYFTIRTLILNFALVAVILFFFRILNFARDTSVVAGD